MTARPSLGCMDELTIARETSVLSNSEVWSANSGVTQAPSLLIDKREVQLTGRALGVRLSLSLSLFG